MKRIHIVIAFAVIMAVTIVGVVFFYSQPAKPARPLPKDLVGIVLPEARPLEPFHLTDIDEKPFDLERLKGKWSLLFFGYTHCPDICPTTLTTLRLMARQLQQTPEYYENTQFIFISVDPKRDTLPHLKEYVGYFHPDFLAVTGKKAAIDKLSRQVGAVYMFDGDTSSDDYIVNHSASIALLNPQGEWIGRFNPPHKASSMAEDFRRLRDYYQQ